MMRVRIVNKLFLSHFLAIVLVSGSIGSYFYFEAARSLKTNLQGRLMNSAALASLSVDAATLDGIVSPADTNQASYGSALTTLRELKATNPDIAYLYIMRQVGDRLEFVVDSDETDAQALPGQAYTEELPSLRQGFERASVDDRIYADEWGAFMSGYAPLRNGRGVYLVGMDMHADEVRHKFRQLQVSGIISLALSILLAVVFSRLLARHFHRAITLLVDTCSAFSRGDYRKRVELNSSDELDDLMSAFNRMAEQLQRASQRDQEAGAALAAANAELEQRVRERTRDLSEVNLRLTAQIDETRKASEATRRAESQLLQAHKLETIGVMAGGIAHDFNNLLFGVLGQAELLLAESGCDEGAREKIRAIKAAALRSRELTSHMLTYAGKFQSRKEPLDINQLLRDMQHLLQGAIAHTARLELATGSSLPMINADGTQIRQVIMNLVINAAEALQGERGTISVRSGSVEATRKFFADCYFKDELAEDTYVFVEVTDGGAGIAEQDLPRIFDPFFTTKQEGRGLGLSVVAGIVRSHRGAIKVRVHPNHGTSFTVFFPAARPPEMPVLPVSQTPAVASRPVGRVILIVEDEPMIRHIMQRMLEADGYAVECAESGRSGIDCFAAAPERFGLVIVDWTMPDMKGDAVIEAIRGVSMTVPILLASGYQADELNPYLDRWRVADFLQKPFERRELSDVVRRLMG